MTTSRKVLALLASTALIAACGDSTGPVRNGQGGSESFEWSGQIAPGGTVEIKGIGGDIRAAPSVDGKVHVRAVKKGTTDDPSTVRIEVVEHDGGVTVCTLYPGVPDRPRNECLPGRFRGQLSNGNNDVTVSFEVRVPKTADFAGAMVGGAIEAKGLDGDVFATTVAGDIGISTKGLASASTISGDITATIGLPDWDRDLAFSSQHGDVTIWIPAATNARVSGSAMSGGISTEFPLTITRLGSARHMSGVLGSGGRNLMLTTMDGNIALRAK